MNTFGPCPGQPKRKSVRAGSAKVRFSLLSEWTKVRKYDLPGHLVSKKYAEPACDHHQRIFFTMVPRVVPTIVFFLRFSPKIVFKIRFGEKIVKKIRCPEIRKYDWNLAGSTKKYVCHRKYDWNLTGSMKNTFASENTIQTVRKYDWNRKCDCCRRCCQSMLLLSGTTPHCEHAIQTTCWL